MIDLNAIAALIAALGVGSLFGQWIASGKDRRIARADALRAIALAERQRWAGVDTVASYQALVVALRELESACLLARAPRRHLLFYSRMATASLLLSRDSMDRHGGEPDDGGGAINADFADQVSDAARLLIGAVWQPGRARLTGRFAIWCLDKASRKVDDSEVQSALNKSGDFGLL